MKKIFYITAFFLLFLQSCTEPYALQTETFESALVIEATITDEYKLQEIKLSRTYRLEEDGPNPETGAVVYVTDNNGNQYNFTANGDKYISQQEFAAAPNITYQLHVATTDGKIYTSTNEQLTSLTDIDAITASAGVSSSNEAGVQITAKSTQSTSSTEYYRFDYEETNKIIAPHWIRERATVTYFTTPQPPDKPTGEITIEPWPYEAKTCFASEKSKDIHISSTSLNTTNSNVALVRFINATDYKIANRYSIKVTMYNESLAAYNFHDAMKKASTNGSLLSQNQPGFFNGNIKNNTNTSEKVIGFFEVSHISTKRIFFNFEDIFPNHPKPEYPYYCPVINEANQNEFKYYFCFCSPRYAPCPTDRTCSGEYILSSLYSRIKAIYIHRSDHDYLTNIQCGDCTSFASNVRPFFWTD